ncbi:hypothetical protein PM082_004845 [Marasmius tenuissimus]|nr:hypothetical protein PM082_004845 [Marasmius tenuissimus]
MKGKVGVHTHHPILRRKPTVVYDKRPLDLADLINKEFVDLAQGGRTVHLYPDQPAHANLQERTWCFRDWWK